MDLKKLERLLFLGIFLFSFFVFLAHTKVTKTAIFADGRFYYAYTRSIVRDFDLNLINDYRILGIKPAINSRGLAINVYPPGTSLFWLPSFWLADGLINTINVFPKVNLDNSGFGLIHQSAVSATSIFLGTLGLYLVFSFLKKFFSKQVSLFTTFALFSATNLFFYIAVEPINSHAISFFVSSLFVFYFIQKKDMLDKINYFTLGVLGGLAGLVRTQDFLISLLPLSTIFKTSRKLKNVFYLSLGAVLAFLPQIILWKLFFNTFSRSPYLAIGFNFQNPQIFHVLFNTQNGFFMLTPITLLAFLGLFAFRKKNIIFFRLALTFFLLQLYLISSWSAYTQGGSFSIRMLISTYPLLSLGLATAIDKSIKKVGNIATLSVILLLSILNSFLIIRYLLLY